MSRLGISMPILNQGIGTFPDMARLADAAGFDSVWDYEFFRNPFVMQAICARETKAIKHCYGLAMMVGRSPFEMANAAADVDEISGGRSILAIGPGSPGWADVMHGGLTDKPLSRTREYIDALRMSWDFMSTGEEMAFEGQFYSFRSPAVNPFGLRPLARPRIPVYIGAVKPKMMQLAGEKGDGVFGYLWTPEYIKDVVLPNVAIGALRAGREPSRVEISQLLICCISEDRKEAMRRARIQVGSYIAAPVSHHLAEFMGLGEDLAAVVKALREGGTAALENATSDALVKAFSVTGTPDEARDQLAKYSGLLTFPVLHTPYVPPLAGVDSKDAFNKIVQTFAQSK